MIQNDQNYTDKENIVMLLHFQLALRFILYLFYITFNT